MRLRGDAVGKYFYSGEIMAKEFFYGYLWKFEELNWV